MPIPSEVQLTLNQDPQVAKAFAHGLKLLQIRQLEASTKTWSSLLERVSAKYGAEHLTTGQTAIYLGVSLREQKKYTIALPFLKRGVNTFEKQLGAHQATADAIESLSAVYDELKQHSIALPLRKKALNITENFMGPDHFSSAVRMTSLASTYRKLSEYENSLHLQKRALPIYEKIFGANNLFITTFLDGLSDTHLTLLQHKESINPQERALQIFESNFGKDHKDNAPRLTNLAKTFSEIAEFNKALPLQQRALSINERILGPTHPNIATNLDDLGLTYLQMAQYDKAIEFQKRSLSIREKALGPLNPDTALSLRNLAITFSELGQHEKSISFKLRALVISEKIHGVQHLQTALDLNNLAYSFQDLGLHEDALPLLQRSLLINQKFSGLEHRDTASVLSNIASSFTELQQHEKALPLSLRALAINEKVLGPDHPDTARALQNLSYEYLKLRQLNEALPLLQRALAINEKILGPSHPITAKSQSALANAFRELGQPNMSVVFLKSAVNIYQGQRERVSSIGSAELKSYTKLVEGTYRGLASILTDQGRLAEAQLVLDMLKEDEQFEFVRRSANADPRRSRMPFNATEQAWTQRYRQVADRLAALGAEEVALQKQAKLGLSPEQQQRQKALAADLAVARQAFDAFLNELRTSFAQKGPARAVEVVETSQKALRDLQGLLKGLGDDAVLLQYYVTDDRVGMLLTTPGVQLARSTEVNAKDLNRQIGEFRRLLRDPKSNAQPAAQALYQLLVAPVAQDLAQAGAKTVMLSLDGALRYVPFAALHDGQQYLAQKWNLPMYTSVTKDKLRDAVSQEWQAAALGLTQAVGEFDALPAVKAEMRSIVKDGRTGVLPGEVHLDKAFSAARLKDVSQRPFQLLHVASHFRFSPGTEINSFLLLGDGQQLTLGDIRTQNYRFDQVDLLTLSACDTGLGGGRDAQGREIEGFGVIAQQQGAKAVLATLWPVADQSTALLMADLYKRRQSQRLTKIEALRQAQLGLMAQPRYAHPFYWAPFILMGNWK
jgi:CHAT domain-containing protein